MKHILLILTTVLITVNVYAQKRIMLDKVDCVIGDEIILMSEIEGEYARMVAQQGAAPEGTKCFIMDQLLTQRLLLVQAEIDSLVISEEEIESQLDARIQQILQYMSGDEDQFIAYYGKTPAEVKEDFRPDLRDQLMVQRMQQQIISSVTVTPSEVKDFFANIPVDSLPYFNAEVEIAEVVIKPEVNAEQRKIAVDRLTEIRRQIVEEKADFAELATKFSDDPGSGSQGGDLGWTQRGQFVPEFEAAAYNLSKGDLSKIVKSDFGYHLIQLLERRGNAIHTRHILIRPEITEEDKEKARLKLDTLRQLILTDSITMEWASNKFTPESEQSHNNASLMLNGKTGNSYFEIGDLEPSIYFAMDTMSVGQISAPMEFDKPNGETMYRIIRLRSRTEPHQANLEDDYPKIQTAALEQKKMVHLNKWIMENSVKTFVEIDEAYNDCESLKKWKTSDNAMEK